MVNDNTDTQRIAHLEHLCGVLQTQLHEALVAWDESQRLVAHCRKHHGNAEPAPALESVLDTALKVPDVFRAVSALMVRSMVRSEAWARDTISNALFEAFYKRQNEG